MQNQGQIPHFLITEKSTKCNKTDFAGSAGASDAAEHDVLDQDGDRSRWARVGLQPQAILSKQTHKSKAR
jgi:hypothetical protein